MSKSNGTLLTNRKQFPLNEAEAGDTHPWKKIAQNLFTSVQVAVITLDISGLTRNMTYGQHYQLAVYVDCKPCPTRYECVWEEDPPTCSSPR